ncbi:unnamed protein product, partial [marine sediment metagenome]
DIIYCRNRKANLSIGTKKPGFKFNNLDYSYNCW